jgi:hypothetical protein
LGGEFKLTVPMRWRVSVVREDVRIDADTRSSRPSAHRPRSARPGRPRSIEAAFGIPTYAQSNREAKSASCVDPSSVMVLDPSVFKLSQTPPI